MRHPAGSFTQIPIALARDNELGWAALRIGMMLSMLRGQRCWKSTNAIARDLGCSRSLVIEGLAELVKGGHVVREDRPGTSSIYVLQYRGPGPDDPRLAEEGDQNTGQGVTRIPVRDDQNTSQGVTRIPVTNHSKDIYPQSHRRGGRSSAREPCMMLPIHGGKASARTDGQRPHEHEARQGGEGAATARSQLTAREMRRLSGPLAGPDGQWKNRLSNYAPGDDWDEGWGPRPEGDVRNPQIPDVTWQDWRQRHGVATVGRRSAS